jgi:endoglucanase
MKKIICLALTLLSGIGLEAQTNTILFQNDPASLIANVLTGTLIKSNEAIRAQLYYAPDGTTDEAAFVPVGTPAPVGVTPGRYNGGYKIILGAVPGTFVMIQVRAYESTYGSTYEQAEAAPAGANGRRALVGKSAVARVIPGAGPTNSSSRLVGPFSVNVAGGGPFFTVNDIIVAEGSNGLYQAVFTVSLIQVQEQTVSVDYATRDGTALAGEDYQPVNGTLTFNPGERAKTVTVVLTADVLPEPDETFYLALSNPSGGAIIRPQGSCLITEVRVTGLTVDTSISFNTVSNRFYMVEKSLNNVDWRPVPGATNVAGNGGIVTVLDRGSGCAAMAVYRASLIDQ